MTTTATRTCPQCAEEVKAEARVCRFCGHRLDHADGPQDTTRIAVLGAIAAVATLIIPVFGLAAFLAAIILAVRGRPFLGAAILITSVLAFGVWSAAVSDAAIV